MLLEEAANELDLRFVIEDGRAGPTYERHVTLLHERTRLREEEQSYSDLISGLAQHLVLLSSTLTNPTSNQQLIDLTAELLDIMKRRKQVVNTNDNTNYSLHFLINAHHTPTFSTKITQKEQLSKLEAELGKGFAKHDGPFVRGLDEVLDSFNVQRQAYYSGTFVGNHVHATLKVNSLNIDNNNHYLVTVIAIVLHT